MHLKPLGDATIATLQRMLNTRARAFLEGPEIDLDLAAIYARFAELWHDERDDTRGLFHYTDPIDKCAGEWAGLDLPILLTKHDRRGAGQAKGIVMVVGQDPLRHKGDFEGKDGRLIVGTPYAAHAHRYREGRTRLYMDIITPMLDDYDVYLTDVHKLGSTTKGGGKWRRDGMFDMEMLTFEFGIAPQKVILFGKVAQDAFARTKGALGDAVPESYAFPHPRARKESWAKALGTHPGIPFLASDKNKVAHILATAGIHGANKD